MTNLWKDVICWTHWGIWNTENHGAFNLVQWVVFRVLLNNEQNIPRLVYLTTEPHPNSNRSYAA